MRRAAALAALLTLLNACDRESKPAAVSTVPPQFVSSTISDPKTFNPILIVDNASRDAVRFVFDSLVRTNVVTLETEPALAERWESDAAGTTWTFHLRRGVRWHDGKPLTSADVVFTFRAVFDERVPNSSKYTLTVDGEPIAVSAIDDYTVKIETPRPFAPLLSALEQDILPAHLLSKSLDDGEFVRRWGIDVAPEKIIGSGPYRMTQYVPAQFIRFERNPDYWRKDAAGQVLPYIDRRTALIVPNQDTAYLKFLAGETTELGPRPEEVNDLRQKAASLHARVEEVGIDAGNLFVAFNRNPRHYVRDGKRNPRLDWFTDPRFLRAVAHAVDKQSMIVNCFSGHARPAVSMMSPSNGLYHNPNLQDYEYDLARARALLTEGGYVDRDGDGVREDQAGNPVEFNLNTNSGNQVREKVCSILKEDWTKLGLKVNYRPLDFTALVERLDSTYEWDAILIGFTGTPEPNNGANLLRSNGNLHLWHPRQETPATAWEAEIDSLLDQGSRALKPEERRPFYWRIQEILHRELPMIQTVHEVEHVAYRDNLQNYRRTVWGLEQPEAIRFGGGPAALD
jgi:peptide/nickel transport system substrate-binding protein